MTGETMTAGLNAQQVQEAALRDNANSMLAALPEGQQAFFHRIHDAAPWRGWVNCPVEHGLRRPLAEAHDLLVRSITALSKAESR